MSGKKPVWHLGGFPVCHGLIDMSRHCLRLASGAYRSWEARWRRCTQPSQECYVRYGGRGIKVCKRWEKFENFLADMGERPEGLPLDRKKNGLGYFPSNCQWSTTQAQSENRRNCRNIRYQGRIQTLAAWARELNIPYRRISDRILKLKWSPQQALATPGQKRGPSAA